MVAAAPVEPEAKVLQYYPRGGALKFLQFRGAQGIIWGPAGTGKTLGAMHKLHLAARKYPGIRILLCRKVENALTTGAMNTYVKHVRPELDGVVPYGGSKFSPAEFRYPNGSVIIPTGLDKSEKVMSAEFDIIFVNEVTECTEKDWDDLASRLRNFQMPYQQLLGDCNPAGSRHWVRRRIMDGRITGFPSSHRDNPAYWDETRDRWTRMGRAYVQEILANFEGVQRDRLFLGKWVAAQGVVYRRFDPETMVKAVDIDGWRKVQGVDIGGKHPTVVLTIAFGYDGRTHVAREFYRSGLSATQIVEATSTEARIIDPESIWFDPSALPYITSLQIEQLPVHKANNSVRDGIQLVTDLVQPGLFTVDPSCVNTISEFENYVYNPKEEIDAPLKQNDHCMDALRYGVMGYYAGEDGESSLDALNDALYNQLAGDL